MGDSRNLIEEIMDVWGDYDDFDSVEYVLDVIEEDIEEIRESKDWGEMEKEFADIAICSLRYLEERSGDADQKVIERLRERMDGHQEEIIENHKQT